MQERPFSSIPIQRNNLRENYVPFDGSSLCNWRATFGRFRGADSWIAQVASRSHTDAPKVVQKSFKSSRPDLNYQRLFARAWRRAVSYLRIEVCVRDVEWTISVQTGRRKRGNKNLIRRNSIPPPQLAEQQTTVGAEDYTTLQTIVARTQLFKNLQYVQSLANLVVNPSVANQYYQGDPLGNLSPSSTNSHLTKLVDKWFLGMDHPATDDVTGPVTWLDVDGTLFDGPPSMNQIHQGDDGDCYFLSGMESIAIQNPRVIENMFIVNGDGTYTVRFYDGKTPVYLTVDSKLPIHDDTGKFVYDDKNFYYYNSANVLWSALAEKAYVQLCEFGWSQPDHTENAYSSIKGGNAGHVMEQVTGKPANDYHLDQTTAAATAKAFLDGKSVVINSKDPSGSPYIVSGHAYAMVGYDRKTHEFELFNPWGLDNKSQNPALLWLTWQQITDNFVSTRVGSKI
jgi:Calpain family cysteine protease